MTYAISVMTTEELPIDIVVRARRKILRKANEEIGWMWWRKYLRMHFRRGAAQRYGYKPRSAGYRRKKRHAARTGRIPRKAESNDLVYSGETERAATSNADVRGFPSRASVKMTTPSYVRDGRPRRNQPWLAEEIKRTTEAEGRDLALHGNSWISREVMQYRKTKTLST